MKHAIVTGGAGLIGAELCTALQMADYEVASFDIRQAPAGIRSMLCDVSDEAAVAAAFAELGWASLDLLVNNAGIASPDRGPITALSLDEWRMVTDSHLTAAFLMTRAAVPLMGEGRRSSTCFRPAPSCPNRTRKLMPRRRAGSSD